MTAEMTVEEKLADICNMVMLLDRKYVPPTVVDRARWYLRDVAGNVGVKKAEALYESMYKVDASRSSNPH